MKTMNWYVCEGFYKDIRIIAHNKSEEEAVALLEAIAVKVKNDHPDYDFRAYASSPTVAVLAKTTCS